MHRVLYVFLPNWPIDRLRHAGSLPSANSGARSGDKAPFATVVATGGRQLLAAVNPARTGSFSTHACLAAPGEKPL